MSEPRQAVAPRTYPQVPPKRRDGAPDPAGAPPAGGAGAWPLDEAVAATRTGPAWGLRPVVVPLVVMVAVIVAGQVLAHTLHLHSPAARVWATVLVNGGAQLALAVGVWWGGRGVAAAHGGWAVFGWRRPTRRDLRLAAAGLGAAFAGRVAVGIVMGAVSYGTAAAQSRNLHITHLTWAGGTVLVVSAVVCAPLLEELTFRGLVLRTLMRRWGFVPAAAASTVVFAAFHTHEVHTALGALTLALTVAVMAAVNCMLVRHTDRLAAGMYVHAALNALAVTVALAAAAT